MRRASARARAIYNFDVSLRKPLRPVSLSLLQNETPFVLPQNAPNLLCNVRTELTRIYFDVYIYIDRYFVIYIYIDRYFVSLIPTI